MRSTKTTHILRSLGAALAVIALLAAGAFYWRKHQETVRHDRLMQTLKKNAETVRFMENKGQFPDKNVLYYFDTKQGAAYVERDRIRFVAYETEEREAQADADAKPLVAKPKKDRVVKSTHTFALNLAGSNPAPKVKLGQSFGTQYNYFLGADSTQWTTGVQAAKDLTLEDVYPGVNLRLYSTDEGTLEFDWVMAPGADYGKVKMHFTGQDGLAVAEDGSLKVGLRFTDVKFHLPESYQVTDKGKQNVNVAFNKTDENTITFATDAKVDERYPLVIDPTLQWGSLMDGNQGGGSAFDEYLYAIQTDSTTNIVYCAGATNVNIPTNAAPYTADGYLNTITGLNGGQNTGISAGVVYRISADGTTLIDLTLYGPSSNPGVTGAYSLSLSTNRVFVGGASDVDVPTTAGAFDTTRSGKDGFVAVFPKDLGTLTYATYIGSSGDDTGVYSIRAIDDSTFVIGANVAAALPAAYISAGAANSTSGSADGYIAKFITLSTLSFGTYVGGAGTDSLNDIEVLADGRMVFIGTTNSSITEVNGAAGSSGGSDDDFLLGVLNNSGTAFTYLDKIGGSSDDRGYDTDVYNGKIYFTGVSASSAFPATAGVFSTTRSGSTDAIIGTVDLAGGAATYKASYYGGSGGNTLGNSLKLLFSSPCIPAGFPNPVLLVFGTTTSGNLSTQNVLGEPFFSATKQSGNDIFFAGFTSDLVSLKYATYMGGNRDDYLGQTGVPRGANNLWFDGSGNVYVGTTTHSDLPHVPVLVSGGFDTNKSNGTNDTHIIFKVAVSTLGVSDYGDALASFGAPSHAMPCDPAAVKLRIGALVDPESGPFPSVNADGDDLNNTDDEDGVTTPPTLTAGGPQTITVNVDNLLNTTGGAATLYGWIDLNSDGQFQASEERETSVANGFTGTKTLTWTNVTVSGATPKPYLRVRLTTDVLADVAGTATLDERSNDPAGDGEVEDYLLAVNASADLMIVKTDGVTAVNAGGTTTYTITVTNNGPSSADGAIFTDPAATGLTATSVTCGSAMNGAVCPTAGNTTVPLMQGAGIVIPTLPSGGSLVFTVMANVTATSGSVTNTANIAAPAGVMDPTPANNSATDTDTPTPVSDLAITKTDGSGTYTPGASTTYTITVSNTGPSAVTNAPVTDTFPAAITSAMWTCVASGGSSCGAPNGAGNIATTANLAVGGSVTFTVTASISPNATGNLVNTATVATPAGVNDPTPANNTATDIDTLGPAADIVVQKNGTGIVQINGAVNYTVEITNLGPSSADGTTFVDTLPANLANPAAVCVSAVAGAVCPGVLNVGGGTVTGIIPTLPPGGSLVITITGNAPGAIGMMTNVATAATPPGVLDPNPGNNTSAAMTQVINVPVPPIANLAVTKVGTSTVLVNGVISYVVTVANAGPGAANGATFNDTVLAAITNVSWTCHAAGGAVCPNANGVGNVIAQTIATLPANGQLIYTVSGTAPGSVQALNNTATVAPPAGVTDPDPGDNTANQPTVVTTTPPTSADLVIAKTGPANVAPNGQMTYTITVVNTGPAAADGAVVSDNLPNVLSNVSATCSATGGAICGATSVGVGNVLTGVITKMPVWGIVTYTITATAPASGSFANSATVTPPPGVIDPDMQDNTGGPVVTTVGPTLADLASTKTNNTSTVVAGAFTTYTVVVTNNGPAAVTNAAVNDNLPANLVNASWTCQASAGSSCTSALGNGSINANVSLLNGGTATFTVTAQVLPTATGTLQNTATVTPPPGVTDPNPNNNSATDGLDIIQQVADLAIQKTDNTGIYIPGGQTTYTVVAVNNGPSAVVNAAVADPLPASITSATWTCGATVGSSCGAALGNGSIATTVSLLPGGQAVFTIHAVISPSATGNLVNTATVTPPAGVTDPTPGNNTSTDTDTPNPIADLVISKTNNAATVTPGGQTTYVIKVTNNGPSSVVNAPVADTLPAALTNATWTCTATAGSSCGAAAGNGNIATTVSLLPGGMATFSLKGTIAASASGNLVNTATIAPPLGFSDTNPADNSATDTDLVIEVADLTILKANFVSQLAPGGQTQYTILVTNLGPSNVTNAAVNDTPPASLTNVTWTCVASAGSTCGATNGAGSIATTVNLLAGGTATFLLNATVSQSATGTISNTATVTPATVGCRGAGCITDPTPGNNTSTDTDPVQPTADLVIFKTAAQAQVPPGGTVNFTVTVRNNGPSDVTGATVTDTFSLKLTGVTWACSATVGSACGAANGTGNIVTTVNLKAGGTATFAVTGTVAAGATGTIENVASVTPAAGVTDPNTDNNTSPVVIVIIGPGPDLAISKTHTGNFQVGQQANYTIRVRNIGPVATFGLITVADTLPNGLVFVSTTGPDWACNAVGQAVTCTNPGPIPSGGSSEFTLRVFVTSVAFPSVVNTAVVSTPGDSNAANNTANDPTIVENGQAVAGNPFPATSQINDQKPGSILIYPVYTSDATTGTAQNTRLAITNSDPARPVAVHLFFVDGSSCAVSDSYICLTAQQTTSFLASDVDPGTTGYVIAVAVNSEGCPIIFNELIGDEYVKFASGHAANLGAEAVAALPGLLGVPCTLNTGTVTLNFDGVIYNALPRVLAADSIGSRADGNDTLLIVDRIGGNLGTGASTLGTLFGIMYDDSEVGLSFQMTGSCQLRGSLSNNFPRTTPRFEQFIAAGRTGWMKFWSQSSAVGIVGAAIRFNPNAATSAGAFSQGHNLHKLTLTTEANVILPVFPPSCL